MKKLILAIAAFAAMSISASAAEVTGSILSTDIGTLIDGAPCKTYNVDGRTVVIAEDLRGYGFDVVYDDSIRRLTITQNPYSERTILSKEEINIEKSSITVGQWLGDMFATDITVYLGDEQIEGYAIDGRMVIPVRALEKCTYVEFDSSAKLVYVNGLQHYLTTRYEAGNPYVTCEVNEQIVSVYDRLTDQAGRLYPHSSSGTTTSKITTASDTENGTISAYWGNPHITFGSGRWHYARCYDKEVYTIRNKNGRLLYDTYIYKAYYGGEAIGGENSSSYIRNDSYINRGYFSKRGESLYDFVSNESKDYYCYWPSEWELTAENVNFTGFTQDGKLLTDTGILCKISDNQLKAERYNISDSYTSTTYRTYYLSKDGKLYKAGIPYFSNEINSIFDECIGENIIKYNPAHGLALKNNFALYSGTTDSLPIKEGVKDFIHVFSKYAPYLAVIDESNNLCIGMFSGTDNDFVKNNLKTIDTDVTAIYTYKGYAGDNGTLLYLNNNFELYKYDIESNTQTKLADNIRKIINAELFITTNDELTDLTNIVATNVKDASNSYILTNDNTIISRTTGEQIFPKP